MDISENGRKIAEKLFTLLNEQQKRALTQYMLDWKNKRVDAPVRVVPKQQESPSLEALSFTEIQVDNLFFCLEERKVLVRGQEIPLTAREFNAFQFLITNRRQIMTFEMITDHFTNRLIRNIKNVTQFLLCKVILFSKLCQFEINHIHTAFLFLYYIRQ